MAQVPDSKPERHPTELGHMNIEARCERSAVHRTGADPPPRWPVGTHAGHCLSAPRGTRVHIPTNDTRAYLFVCPLLIVCASATPQRAAPPPPCACFSFRRHSSTAVDTLPTDSAEMEKGCRPFVPRRPPQSPTTLGGGGRRRGGGGNGAPSSEKCCYGKKLKTSKKTA